MYPRQYRVHAVFEKVKDVRLGVLSEPFRRAAESEYDVPEHWGSEGIDDSDGTGPHPTVTSGRLSGSDPVPVPTGNGRVRG